MPSAKKRGGLGRGLNALVSEAEYETGGSAASASNAASETKLPIEDIVPNLINREFTLMKLNFAS
mgnify:FL=1